MVISAVGIPAVPCVEETLLGTPARAGNLPVKKPARDAEQIADGEYICVKRIPCVASLSKFGVSKSSEP